MTWFTASILISIKPEDYLEGPFEVYENMYLIEAVDSVEALAKAEMLGRGDPLLVDDDSRTVDGKRAVSRFVGIRKLVSVSNPYPYDLDGDRPCEGTEVTYALYQVADESAALELARGEAVDITYLS